MTDLHVIPFDHCVGNRVERPYGTAYEYERI